MFQDKRFFRMNVRLGMYKYCYSNEGTIYAKGLYFLALWVSETKEQIKLAKGKIRFDL